MGKHSYKSYGIISENVKMQKKFC